MKADTYGKTAKCHACGCEASQHAPITPHPCVSSPRCTCTGFVWSPALWNQLMVLPEEEPRDEDLDELEERLEDYLADPEDAV